MSPTSDFVQIKAILLADGWHEVEGKSFHHGPFTIKDEQDQAWWPMGDSLWWEEPDGGLLIAPVSSILAIKR